MNNEANTTETAAVEDNSPLAQINRIVADAKANANTAIGDKNVAVFGKRLDVALHVAGVAFKRYDAQVKNATRMKRVKKVAAPAAAAPTA